MHNAKEESRQEASRASVKRTIGMIGLVIGFLVALLIGIIFFLLMWQINPMLRYWFESTSGPIGQIFVDTVSSTSDALFGWI